MSDSPENPAGWYPDPQMAGTQRYWDGARWTEHRAPMPARQASGTSTGKIVGAILLSVLILVVVGGFAFAVVTADDELQCASENAERSMDGLPPADC